MSLINEAHKKLADELNKQGFKAICIDENKYPLVTSQCSVELFIDITEDQFADLGRALTQLGYQTEGGDPIDSISWGDWDGSKRFKYPGVPVAIWGMAIVQNYADSQSVVNEINDAIVEGWGAELFEAWKDLGLLGHFFPELAACVNHPGGDEHGEDVYTHLITALRLAPNHLRQAALFHDIGKPVVYKVDKDGKATFHRHEVASYQILENFMARGDIYIQPITGQLVLHHMFYFESEASDKAIRHWLAKVGRGTWEQLFELRAIDRRANFAKAGKPAVTSELKKLQARIEKIIASGPVFRDDLSISRNEVYRIANLEYLTETALQEIFSNLLGLVQKDPEKNTGEYLREYVGRVYGPKLAGD